MRIIIVCIEQELLRINLFLNFLIFLFALVLIYERSIFRGNLRACTTDNEFVRT